jgi:autotransporter-associated beta strand protein
MHPISRSQWPWTATARCPISRHTIALTLSLIVLGLASTPDTASADTRTWKGSPGGNTWLNINNWVGNVQPAPGDTLIFPEGAAGTVVNDFPADTKFAAITVAEGYTITGARIQLTNSLTVTNDENGQAWISANILLEAPVTGTKTFVISAGTGTRLLVTGVISGNDTVQLRKEGPGLVIMNAIHGYAGATTVAEGSLEIQSIGALGLASKGTTVQAGATLRVDTDGTITEPLTLIGDDVQAPEGPANLSVGKPVLWNAPIALQGASAPLIVTSVATAELRLSGVISGPQGLALSGRAPVTLSGPSSNTYAGVTSIWRGEVLLDKNPGATAVPAGLVIGLPQPASAATIVLGNSDQIQSTVTIDETGSLVLDGASDTISALVLKGGKVTTHTGTLTLAGNMLVSQSTQTAVIEGNLSLGNDSRTFNVVSTAKPGIDIKAVIKSPIPAGLTKTGVGIARFGGANSYTGNTVITMGTIELAHASALGPGGATVIKTNGRLDVAADGSTEPLFPEGTPGTDGPTIAAVGPGKRTFNGNIIFSGPLLAFADIGASLHLGGSVSGSGGDLKFVGLGTVIELAKPASYTGSTLAAGARIKLMAAQVLPDASRVELLPSGQLDLNGFNDTIGGLASNTATSVFLGGAALTVATKAGNTDTYAGAFSGVGNVVKTGTGTWVLTGTSAAAIPLRVAAGTVRVMGSIANEMTLGGGTLEGIGSVGTIAGPAGTLRPGSSPGVLHSKSVFNLGAGVTVAIAINGPVVGTEYAQLDVTGSVNLGQASLALAVSPSFLPAGAGDLIIVNNDGTDPIVGTFSGLPEGAVVDAGNGKTFLITYAGGTGNDVALSAQGGSSYYLSEGATGGFFDLDILIANPNAADAPVTLTFLREDGGVVNQQRTVPAMQRITVRVDDIAGVEDTPVSTVVNSDNGSPLIVERTMRWDQSGYGAHTEKAAGGMALTWYFAEGSQGFFSTYLLLANPGTAASVATVQYLREGLPALTRTYPIAAGSRFTVNAGADPELVNTSFGMTVTFDQPGIAERAMYFGSDPVWKGGHESAGVTAPSTTWFLAEGATGPFFETFVLLANPNGADAVATMTFLTSDGAPIVKEKMVPANGRLTVNIESEDPALTNAAVSTKIDASLPVIVERAQYWPDPAPVWYEAHNSFGVTAASTKWGLAEGRAGGNAAYQTYVLIANPGGTAANVTVTFLLEGGAPITKTFSIPPTSRFNVATGEGTNVPEVANQRFGAVLTSDQPIVVERAMYANAGGQTWAAGTNATATRLP